MEAINLLKFWRNSGSDSNAGTELVSDETDSLNYSTKYTDVSHIPASETDDDSDNESFFDLVLDGADHFGREKKSKTVNARCKAERGFNFPESPKDVLQLKRGASPISLLRSAPKFRIFFLGFKKTKLEDDYSAATRIPKHQTQTPLRFEQSKRFSVKVADSEIVGASLPCRESSLRSKLQMEKNDDSSLDGPSKRFTKKPVPKYLKLIKPLYGKSSKYNEKSSLNLVSDKIPVTSVLSPVKETFAPARRLSEERQGSSRPGSFSAVRKHLVKSRSASAAASPSVRRRDDSLLEQHDGIQSAILHCKASARGFGSSLLSRSISEPHHQKYAELQRRSYEDTKRCSI
ncbi:unnamed protein product [Cuscuta epithymum]|uniref:Membrane-associated kinase regulator 5 n=1 Tax=Cuscuta epithymum TaxID=186058 RepID=A0AAV0ELT9_9ASTE|nr:unnamed protein product [Cuscuta epithymum]